MDIIVYNTERSQLDISTEALCIRAGLVIGSHVHAVGSSGRFIFFKTMLRHPENNLEFKIGMLKGYDGFKDLGLDPQLLHHMMADLWKKRRDSKSLILYKRMEATLNRVYDEYVESKMRIAEMHGMVQLADLDDKGALIVNHATEDKGEEYDDGYHISRFLQMELENPVEPDSFVFALYGNLADLPEDVNRDLVHLFDLPNMNMLSNERLLALRHQLSGPMQHLSNAVVPTPWPESGKRYGGSIVVRDRLAQASEVIRQAVTSNSELNWVRQLDSQTKFQILIGQIDTKRLWQHMRDHSLVPDDSWEVLQALPPDTPYPRTMPILVMRTVTPMTDHSEELAMNQKRKTLSLD